MFGYVTPCVMELKVKDYEKFRAYYCGLCISIKKNFGNIPRISLNYDMTFLAVLLDGLSDSKCTFNKNHCIVHPLKKRLMIHNNECLDYASFCNVILAYYKLLDDVQDDNSLKSKLFSRILNRYIHKSNYTYLNNIAHNVKNKLYELNNIESNPKNKSLDEISHVFADLTGFIISYYYKDSEFSETLYWLGYNIGKWIYIIDAWDDLEKDMQSNKFNPINSILNTKNLSYIEFFYATKSRIDFILTTCARLALENLNELPIKKNGDILYNILQYGLMEKMDNVFKRSGNNERSL